MFIIALHVQEQSSRARFGQQSLHPVQRIARLQTAKSTTALLSKAVFVPAGSPFDPVQYEGKTLEPGQANNVFIFPGVGFGAVMVKAKTVTDEMFIAAARGLADCVGAEQIEKGNIYPRMEELRNISAAVSADLIHLHASVEASVCWSSTCVRGYLLLL